MHSNSVAAYRAIEDSLPQSRRRVFRVVWEHYPLTRQDIAEQLGVPINQVTGRVKELLETGKIEECGSVLSPTNRPRALLVPTAAERQLEFAL